MYFRSNKFFIKSSLKLHDALSVIVGVMEWLVRCRSELTKSFWSITAEKTWASDSDKEKVFMKIPLYIPKHQALITPRYTTLMLYQFCLRYHVRQSIRKGKNKETERNTHVYSITIRQCAMLLDPVLVKQFLERCCHSVKIPIWIGSWCSLIISLSNFKYWENIKNI